MHTRSSIMDRHHKIRIAVSHERDPIARMQLVLLYLRDPEALRRRLAFKLAKVRPAR